MPPTSHRSEPVTSCRLCEQRAQLRASHVIPEFVYKPLYDEKHRFHVLSTLRAGHAAKEQKGLRESLLCARCEDHLSRFERYASLVMSGRMKISSVRDGNLLYISGLEYRTFKLFALSVLWRAGVSSLNMFSQVTLGPHEAKLREMIQHEDPGPSNRYPFLMSPVVHNDVVQSDLIMQPTWTKVDGHYAYRFVFGGIAWVYIVSNHSIRQTLRPATLSENGAITMMISQLGEMNFVIDLLKELHAANGRPKAGK